MRGIAEFRSKLAQSHYSKKSNKKKEFGKLSRNFLNSLVVGKDLEIRRITKNRYTRNVAELSLKGENIQQMMVKRGYAQIYSKYSFQCPWAR